jgi:hydroxymethylbilane synthase
MRIGTRGSALARAQAGMVAQALESRHPGLEVELVFIRTSGDQLARGPLAAVAGKGLFVREIEEALLAGTVDVGVHSLKDMPARLRAGLELAAVPPRADPRDVLVSHAGGLDGLPAHARVGTASVRRRAQLRARRRDLEVLGLRGNVDTRLRRWREGAFDAIVLAAAGLARLGIEEPAATVLPPDVLVPAVGQGALALECRADDAGTQAVVAALDDPASACAVGAERAFLLAIGGDCNTPIAAHAEVDGDRLRIRALVSDLEGERCLAEAVEGASRDAEALGREVAARLLARGAEVLLAR